MNSIKQHELAKQRERLFKEVAKLVDKQKLYAEGDYFDAYDQIQIRIDELKWIPK